VRTKRNPTHVLYVEIPVYPDEDYDFDPVQDAIKAVLAVSRAAFVDAICDDPMVTIRAGATICGLCGGYGAARWKTHEPVPCIACGKKSEGVILLALDLPGDVPPPEGQRLGLYLVHDSEADRRSLDAAPDCDGK